MKKSIYMIMAIMYGLVSCSGGKEQNTEHQHEAELQMTSYTNGMELFVKAEPLSKGQESHFEVYLTRLPQFKPVEKGELVIRLENKESKQTFSCKGPAHPGIYEFSICPEKEGLSQIHYEYHMGDSLETFMTEVMVYSDAHEAAHETEEKMVESSNGTSFSKKQSWSVDFATEVCHYQNFGSVIRSVGQILPAQGDEQLIVARTGGIISFDGKQFTEGKDIWKGQPLFHINGSEMTDNNLAVKYKEAENNYNITRTEYERKIILAEEKIVSESDLLRAKRDFESAKIIFNNLKTNFVAGKQSITAPMDGFLKEIFVREGEYVTEGQAVANLSQNRKLLVRAQVPSRYFSQLKNISTATFKSRVSSETYELEELDGKLLSYSRSTSIDDPLLAVTFQIANSKELLSGSFMDIAIRTIQPEKRLTVPTDALIEQMGNYFVFVQLTPEYFEKREVTLGESDGIRTAILSGIKENERIVSKGAGLLKLAQATGKLDAHDGHNH